MFFVGPVLTLTNLNGFVRFEQIDALADFRDESSAVDIARGRLSLTDTVSAIMSAAD